MDLDVTNKILYEPMMGSIQYFVGDTPVHKLPFGPNFSKAELDTKLGSFYAELRNTKGELYKHTSLLSIRSGRHLSKLN
jgi:hypothetical protein